MASTSRATPTSARDSPRPWNGRREGAPYDSVDAGVVQRPHGFRAPLPPPPSVMNQTTTAPGKERMRPKAPMMSSSGCGAVTRSVVAFHRWRENTRSVRSYFFFPFSTTGLEQLVEGLPFLFFSTRVQERREKLCKTMLPSLLVARQSSPCSPLLRVCVTSGPLSCTPEEEADHSVLDGVPPARSGKNKIYRAKDHGRGRSD